MTPAEGRRFKRDNARVLRAQQRVAARVELDELGVALKAQEGAFKVLAKKALHRGGELLELVDLFTEKKPPSSKAKPKV